MLTFGITGAKKKKKSTKRTVAASVARLFPNSMLLAPAPKTKKRKAKVGPDGLTAAQRARKKKGLWASYGTSSQKKCTTAARKVRAGRGGGRSLAKCRVPVIVVN